MFFLPLVLVAIGILDFNVVVLIFFIGAPVAFIVIVMPIVVSTATRLTQHKWRVDRRRIEQFKQYARVEASRVILPEEAVVELGDIVLKGYWAIVGSGRGALIRI